MASTKKSTIARIIAHLFADAGQLGISFFFKKSDGNCSTASRFFLTIATNLMACLPDLILSITKVVDADRAISEKAPKDQFEKMILQPLLKIR